MIKCLIGSWAVFLLVMTVTVIKKDGQLPSSTDMSFLVLGWVSAFTLLTTEEQIKYWRRR